jgi:hypothetical protein
MALKREFFEGFRNWDMVLGVVDFLALADHTVVLSALPVDATPRQT